MKVCGQWDQWLQTSPPSMGWCSVATSSSGEYIGAVNSGPNLGGPGTVYITSNYGSTWSMVTSVPSDSWTSVTLSSTGKYVAIVGGGSILNSGLSSSYIYTSSDYGATWTQTGLSTSWISIASSSSGAMIFATSTVGCYLSSNFGQTWSLSSQMVTYYIASSASGQYLLSSNDNVLYISSDSGDTWVTWSTGFGNPWKCVTVSSTGQYMYAGMKAGGYIYMSSNFGIDFTATSFPFMAWQGVTTDSTGQYLAANNCCGSGSVYISTNYGTTYSLTKAPATSWLSIASSDSFSLLVAAAVPGYNY